MITEKIKHLDDYYGHQKQSNQFWKPDGKQIHKIYTIEYCDDERKFNCVGIRKEFGGLDIDDAYHAIHFEETENDEFDTFDGIVMETYLHMLFNPKILDVKLWEQIFDGDEMVSERWIAFPCTFTSEMAKVIAKDIKENRDALRKTNEALTKENEELREFIQIHKADNAFREWQEERGKK